MLRSTNEGSTWIPEESTIRSRINSVLEQRTLRLAATEDGVYVSKGIDFTWHLSSTGLLNTDVVQLFTRDSILFGQTGSGVYSSSDSGTSWHLTQLPKGISSIALIDKVLLGASGSEILASEDNGASWDTSMIVKANKARPGVLCLAGLDKRLFAGTENGVFLSVDKGRTWTEQVGTPLSRVECLYNHANTLYAADGDLYCLQRNRVDWIKVPTGSDKHHVISIASSAKCLFIGTWDHGLFKSLDNGQTWRHVLSSGYIDAIHVNGSYIIASTREGFYASADEGETWVDFSEGLGKTRVNTISTLMNNVYVGTKGYGVWKRPIRELIELAEAASKSLSIRLQMETK
ncbi:MAG: hypothetical protein IPI29_14450 [Ignavibacteria bacterium]|nr:hypothetical protein [Ignavibacteria bacterium]